MKMPLPNLDTTILNNFLSKCEGFERFLKDKIIIHILSNGRCTAELKIDETFLNPIAGMHGGLSATLVDCISRYALMTKIGIPGLSSNMHLSYLKGAKLGDEVLIEANVTKVGKTLAFLEAEIRNKATGDVLVKGSHTKFVAT